MKIALVSPYDYPFHGGVTEHISHLYACFTEEGHQVRILAPSSRGDVENTHPDVFRLGKTIIPVPANQSVARLTLSLTLNRRVKQILAQERFDVVHIHEPLVPALPLTVLRESKTANVATFHAARDSYFGYLYAKPLLKQFIRNVHGRIAVSPAAREFVDHYFPGDYKIIPNGIDVEKYQERRRELPELRDGKINLLFVGRLEKRKGLIYLLKALPHVKYHFPNIRLTVVGAFEEEQIEEYRAFVREMGMTDVVFKGFVSEDEKIAYYQHADVFCSPAIGRESQGVILLEAMAAGTPVLASALDGYRTVIRHEQDGLLVPPADETALAVGLCRLLSDDGLRTRIARAGTAKAQTYAWSKVSRQVLEMYASTIDSFRRLVSPTRRKGSYNAVEWLPAASGTASSGRRVAPQNAS
ncbi:MAG TPA: glycosyltransferase family 4 protein [Chloroflexota bacterium]|nr:glycosyltransferase family 4 protein [Chloroflexota bacterium]